MRCLIIDDEKPALVEMRRLLSVHPDIDVVGEATNVEAALEIFRQAKPEVVFLDIQLRGETGFDFWGQADEPLSRIVFVTAHDRYAIRAFECNALDYLLKPVHPDRLAETLRRVRSSPRPPSRALPEDAVLVKMNSTARFVPWSEIQSVESAGNYTRLFLTDGSSPLIHRPLKEWEKMAPAGHFLRVHRSALVFGKAIREIRPASEGRNEIVMNNGRVIPVGRAFWPNLKAAVVRH